MKGDRRVEEPVSLSLRVDDATDGVEDLGQWLRQEPELRGLVQLVRRPPEPGAMGSLAEVLVAVGGAGGVLVVLAESLKVWLNRPRHAGVKLRIRHGRCREEITITARNGDEVEAILRRLLEPGE
jgi:hypothetical protein